MRRARLKGGICARHQPTGLRLRQLPLFSAKNLSARLPEAPHKPWRCAPLNQALMTVWGKHHLVLRRISMGTGPSFPTP
ncbi:hypothetical protein HYQ44_009884 [Verticillium longisporum]|nr:hypothetical protein HYQ44_009884 [Verticillium longisporum]